MKKRKVKVEVVTGVQSLIWEEDADEKDVKSIARKLLREGFWRDNGMGEISFFPPSRIARINISGDHLKKEPK